MSEEIIQPWPPNDGREYEARCARCGGEAVFEECEECEGDGWSDEDCGDDVVSDFVSVPCDFCRGHGGRYWCSNSRSWCEANPLDSRTLTERGQVEWLPTKKSKRSIRYQQPAAKPQE